MLFGIGRGSAQRCVAFSSCCRVLFLQPLLIGDGLLLHILYVERAPEPVIEIENIWRGLLTNDPAKQTGQLHRVVDAKIQAQAAERIVDVGCITREENAVFAE